LKFQGNSLKKRVNRFIAVCQFISAMEPHQKVLMNRSYMKKKVLSTPSLYRNNPPINGQSITA